jgi:hypothetical protein
MTTIKQGLAGNGRENSFLKESDRELSMENETLKITKRSL